MPTIRAPCVATVRAVVSIGKGPALAFSSTLTAGRNWRAPTSADGWRAWPPVTRTSLSHRSRGDTVAGGVGKHPAAELVNKMLVRPGVSTGDHRNHENGHRRPPEDAAQRRTEEHAVER